MVKKNLRAHFIECLEKGNTKKAKYIVELLGNDVNKLYKGKSLLVWAKEFENEEVTKALEEKGVIEEVISIKEASRLGSLLIGAVESDDVEKVVELIEAGADVNSKDNHGTTSLMEASENGYVEIVNELIENGADVNITNAFGQTALMKALHENCIEVAIKLIEAGADVNIKDNDGQTALMEASCYADIKVIKKLIENGANVNAVNKYRRTVLQEAFMGGGDVWNKKEEKDRFEAVDCLLENGAKKDALANCLDSVYDEQSAKYLIEKGILPKTKHVSWAIGSYYEKVAEIYIDNAEKLNVNAKDDEKKSLLINAIEKNYEKVVDKLIEKGASLDSCNGGSVLLDAAYYGRINIVKKLVEMGEDIDQVNNYNQTPLYLAVLNAKSVEVVEYLLQKGADYNIARDSGETPLMCAVKHEEYKMIKAILNNVDKMPDKFIQAVNMSRDNSDERKLLMDYIEKTTKDNQNGRDKIMLDIIKDRY